MNNNATTLAQAFIPGTVTAPSSPMSSREVVAFIAMMALAITVLMAITWWVTQEEDPWSRVEARLAQALITRSAGLAGARNSHLAVDWRADMAGAPEHGRLLSPSQQVRYGCGCLKAAVRLRAGDAADDVLVSRSRSNAFAGVPVFLAAIFVIRREGWMALILHAEDLACIGGTATAAIHGARKWRGIKPAPRRPRHHRLGRSQNDE